MKLQRNVGRVVRPFLRMVVITFGSIVLFVGMVGEYVCCGMHGRSREELATMQVNHLRTSSLFWLTRDPANRCPRIQDLDAEATDEDLRDPWNHLVIIACDVHGDVIVRSNGPDGRAGTDDDVVSR